MKWSRHTTLGRKMEENLHMTGDISGCNFLSLKPQSFLYFYIFFHYWSVGGGRQMILCTPPPVLVLREEEGGVVTALRTTPPTPLPNQPSATSLSYCRLEKFHSHRPTAGTWFDTTHRNLFLIMLNQTKFGLLLHFSDWFVYNKRNSILCGSKLSRIV